MTILSITEKNTRTFVPTDYPTILFTGYRQRTTVLAQTIAVFLYFNIFNFLLIFDATFKNIKSSFYLFLDNPALVCS